ncbi:ATP-binding cassette domain-containing protein [Yeosuana marina]|uniref:ATP-binding cassette domain-containing protein n=1 Tax=Yeosuana marina TaxID=1565536 RepID=UPI001423B8B6|nr:ATP-binding cassette domain-containing protein [Yeosuana marina]
MNHHFAIYISNNDNKVELIEKIISGDINSIFLGVNGAVFSEVTLNKFIDEEQRHGRFDVVTETKNSLQNSSEGERRKALLQHIISKQPDYLIVDNVFGNLDITSRVTIHKTLSELSTHITIIQITNRISDILSFIEVVYQLKDDNLILFEKPENKQYKSFVNDLPQSYNPITSEINPLVKFSGVSITYHDRPIIKDICWEIKSGEFWQLIGPNGSGKSTILSLITGDNPKAYGQDITLFGVKKGSGESVWDIKKKIGYFSSDMLRGFKRLDSIGNMIASGFFDTVGLYKKPANQQIKIVHQWLHVLGMFDIRKQNFLSLSTGHQTLVLIARSMVKQPPLLILDEPTNGLDDTDAQIFTQLINKISKETNTAILYVSHRKEAGLKPDFVYQLIPNETGSSGEKMTFGKFL